MPLKGRWDDYKRFFLESTDKLYPSQDLQFSTIIRNRDIVFWGIQQIPWMRRSRFIMQLQLQAWRMTLHEKWQFISVRMAHLECHGQYLGFISRFVAGPQWRPLHTTFFSPKRGFDLWTLPVERDPLFYRTVDPHCTCPMWNPMSERRAMEWIWFDILSVISLMSRTHPPPLPQESSSICMPLNPVLSIKLHYIIFMAVFADLRFVVPYK